MLSSNLFVWSCRKNSQKPHRRSSALECKCKQKMTSQKISDGGHDAKSPWKYWFYIFEERRRENSFCNLIKKPTSHFIWKSMHERNKILSEDVMRVADLDIGSYECHHKVERIENSYFSSSSYARLQSWILLTAVAWGVRVQKLQSWRHIDFLWI